MNRICDISGKRANNANRVSFSNKHWARWQYPNLQNKKLYSKELDRYVKLKVAELAQFYYKKRKPPPPKKPQQKQGWGSIIALLGVLVTIAVGVQAWCYHRYGPLFFWSAESKQLDLTPNAWRALLETRSVGFIGGHHRAGTTQLWRSVARHPEVASFGEQRDCGLDFSEGIFAQDVYPRFGVGEVQDFLGSSSSAQKNTGLGRYALGAVEDVHWTEGHFTVSGHAQARVLNRFGFRPFRVYDAS